MIDAIEKAIQLIFSLDPDVSAIVFLSLRVSISAAVISSCIAIPLGTIIALRNFPLKRLVILILNTFLSIPAVAIGLILYIVFTRQGLFGFLELLYTPRAMIIAQAVLAFPIITSLTIAAISNVKKSLIWTAITLGASPIQLYWTVLKEARYAVLAGFIMGFSRIVGETGMTMMVGGNIKGETRVMTTAIALETMKGEFELGIALAIVLLIIAFVLNIFLSIVQGKMGQKK